MTAAILTALAIYALALALAWALAALRNRLNPPDHGANKLSDRGGGVGLNIHNGADL